MAGWRGKIQEVQRRAKATGTFQAETRRTGMGAAVFSAAPDDAKSIVNLSPAPLFHARRKISPTFLCVFRFPRAKPTSKPAGLKRSILKRPWRERGSRLRGGAVVNCFGCGLGLKG